MTKMKSDRTYPHDPSLLYGIWVSYYVDNKTLSEVGEEYNVGVSTLHRWIKQLEITIVFGESSYRHKAGRIAFKNASKAVKSLVRTDPSLASFRKKYRLRSNKTAPKPKDNFIAIPSGNTPVQVEQDTITRMLGDLVVEISRQAGAKYKQEITQLENYLKHTKKELDLSINKNAELMKQNSALEEELDKIKNDHRPAGNWLKMIKDNI